MPKKNVLAHIKKPAISIISDSGLAFLFDRKIQQTDEPCGIILYIISQVQEPLVYILIIIILFTECFYSFF